MSFTWNPRLVKTPTPTMSATTIAVAVIVVTVGRTALLAFAVMKKLTPCPHALLPVLQARAHCFNRFCGFYPPKKWPGGGAAKGAVALARKACSRFNAGSIRHSACRQHGMPGGNAGTVAPR